MAILFSKVATEMKLSCPARSADDLARGLHSPAPPDRTVLAWRSVFFYADVRLRAKSLGGAGAAHPAALTILPDRGGRGVHRQH